MHSVGAQLKVWRKAAKLQQDEAATHLGLSSSTYQNYERGTRRPDTDGWEKFVRAGINANWLLTGEGPMLLADLTALPAQSQSMSFAFDQDRLEKSLEAVEAGLAAAGSTMAPSKKAAVVLAVYDLMQEPSVTSERVLKLIKLAA